MHGNKLYVELKLSYRNSNPFIISKPGAVRNRDNICFRIYFIFIVTLELYLQSVSILYDP